MLLVQFPFQAQRAANAVHIDVLVPVEGIIAIGLTGFIPLGRTGRVIEHIAKLHISIRRNVEEALVGHLETTFQRQGVGCILIGIVHLPMRELETLPERETPVAGREGSVGIDIKPMTRLC